jgi:predicted secreted protein
MANTEKQTGYQMEISISSSVVALARDVTLNLSSNVVGATTRGGDGWEENIQGLKKWSVDMEMVYIADDAGYQALRTAFNTGANVDVILTDKQGNTETGTAIVNDMGRPEPLDDLVTVNVTLTGDGELKDTPVTP